MRKRRERGVAFTWGAWGCITPRVCVRVRERLPPKKNHHQNRGGETKEYPSNEAKERSREWCWQRTPSLRGAAPGSFFRGIERG